MIKQWIFIDDSGDAGFKIGMGSSKYIVFALIIFKNKESIKYTNNKINSLKQKIGWSEHKEFKLNKTNSIKIKIDFFDNLIDCDFKIKAIVVDKTKIYSDNLKNNSTSFYNFLIKQALAHTDTKNAKIIIDGSGDRKYQKQVKSYLRKQITGIEKIDIAKSDGNNLIQLADMVAGSIRRAKEHKSDGEICLNIIKNKIIDIWDFK